MRPGWDEYFMEVARTVATRATCPRASVGAVVVRDHRILTTGYNGAPRHVAHCTEVGCLIENGHCMRTTHAEANAVVQGALHGVSLAGATAYCDASAVPELLEAADQRGHHPDRLRGGVSRSVRDRVARRSGRGAGAVRLARAGAVSNSTFLLFGIAFAIAAADLAARDAARAPARAARRDGRRSPTSGACTSTRSRASAASPSTSGSRSRCSRRSASRCRRRRSSISLTDIHHVLRPAVRRHADPDGRRVGRRDGDAPARQAARAGRRRGRLDALRLPASSASTSAIGGIHPTAGLARASR